VSNLIGVIVGKIDPLPFSKRAGAEPSVAKNGGYKRDLKKLKK